MFGHANMGSVGRMRPNTLFHDVISALAATPGFVMYVIVARVSCPGGGVQSGGGVPQEPAKFHVSPTIVDSAAALNCVAPSCWTWMHVPEVVSGGGAATAASANDETARMR